MNLKALLQERAAEIKARKDLMAKVEKNGFKYAEGEEAQIDAHTARITELDGMIAKAEQAIADEQRSATAGFGNLNSADDEENARSSRESSSSNISVRSAEEILRALSSINNRGVQDPSRIVSRSGPFRTLGEQLQAIVRVGKNPTAASANDMNRLLRVGAYNGANESTDADGGYLVQEEFLNPLVDLIISGGQLASKCRRISTSRPGVVLPQLKETSRADGYRNGGIQAYWVGEGNPITPSKAKWGRMNVPVEKLAILLPMTEELEQDAPALAGYMSAIANEEMAFKVDDAILRGSGNGAPLGILNSPALIQVDKESGQPADTVTTGNIQDMFGRIMPRSKSRMVWAGNQEIYPQLLRLKDDSDENIFLQGHNITNSPVDRLLGREYVEMEQCSAPGDVGDLMALDLSQYLLIDRGGVQSDVSIHFYFDTAENALRMMLRVGGAPIPAAPLTPYKGTKTLSPFVSLQAR